MLINFDSKNVQYVNKSHYSDINSDALSPRDIFDQTIDLNNFTLHGQIGVFENAIPKEMCKYIINNVDNNGAWAKATTVGESMNQVSAANSPRQNDIAWITGRPYFGRLDGFINMALKKTINEYTMRMSGLNLAACGITQDEGYTVLRYSGGGYYHKHIDYSSQKGADGETQTIRVISSLVYLNDNYEGGEIDFPHQDFRLKPKAGTIIFFPSIFTHPHASLNISSGTKYSLVTWWK